MDKYHPTVNRIQQLLEENGVAYKSFEHEAVRTSEEAANIRPEYTISQGTKALILRIKKKDVSKESEKQFIQIVVPGDAKFNPKKARTALDAKDIRFATEYEVDTITGGVLPGGVPPFGNLFNIPVYVDISVFKHEEIIFNAGDKRYSIAMKSEDYKKVVKPIVTEIV